MRRYAMIAVVSATVALQAVSTASTNATTGAGDLARLIDLKGTWTLDGKWANGNPFKARQLVEPMFGNKFVGIRTWSASGDAAETERDFVVFGISEKLELVQWVYTPDGKVRQTVATPTDDGAVQFDWTKTDDKGKATELRTVLNFVDANTYRWRTQMHIKNEWHTLIDGQWKRG